MKDYPRIGSIDRKTYPRGLCKICGCNKSDSEITIEYTYMRGDDDVFSVHKKCIKALKPNQFIKNYIFIA